MTTPIRKQGMGRGGCHAAPASRTGSTSLRSPEPVPVSALPGDDPSRYDFDYYDDPALDEDDEEGWAEAMCSMGPDGYCGAAGSEYCEFECPYRGGL